VARFAAELPPVRDMRSLRTVAGAVRRRALEAVPYRQPRAVQLDPDLAVFAAYGFREYGCNPRAIYERAMELLPNLRGVWIVRHDHVESVPPGVEYVIASTPAYYSVLSRATYFVNNVNFGDDVRKRDGQIHLQTHHGTPIDAAGVDLRQYPGGPDPAELMRRVDRWDYCLSANRFSTEVWERAYPASYQTLEYGFPRNDRLLTATLDEVGRIRSGLGFDDSTQIVLYAPRGSSPDPAELAAGLDQDCVVLVRRTAATEAPGVPSDRVVDVSGHPDPTELLLAADTLVTDHSPLVFDYANLDRPIVLLPADPPHGNYLDLREFPPGVTARSPAEVGAAFADGSYAAPEATKQRHVFRERFCEFDDGRAADRVVRKLFLGADPDPIPPLADRRPAPSPYWLGH
jgi:CDP-glycerol glycerophosphotransferase (TagB/SpsB family)